VMRAMLIVLALGAVAIWIAKPSRNGPTGTILLIGPPPPPPPHETIEACVAAGMAQYRSAGTYPLLTNGREAAVEAQDRCRGSLSSFPALPTTRSFVP
jgi:hypothetical protein